MDLKDEDSVINRVSHNFKETKKDGDDELTKLHQQQQSLINSQTYKQLEKIFSENSTRSIKVSNVQIEGTEAFRESFLINQIQPLISKSTNVSSLLSNVDLVSSNFTKTGAIKDIQIKLDTASSYNPYRSTPASIEVIPKIKILPINKFMAKTGTNIGNGEGDGYMNFQWRNIFGGGENLMFDATTGTRTRSSYLLNYSMPFVINTSKNQLVWRFDNSVFTNSRKIDWSSHEQLIKGITNKISSLNSVGWNHEFGMETLFRSITNVDEKRASNNIMYQAGDDLKNSFTYKLNFDSRDDRILPTKGAYFLLNNELSGLLTKNSSNFLKSSLESSIATSSDDKRFILNASFKTGFLYTLDNSGHSHLVDRFYIGGPNDVRSFFFNGLGPRNSNDTLGGDLFLNGGLSLFTKIGKFDALKVHNFINFGRLIPWDHNSTENNLIKLINQPSIGIGIGLVFKHPVARFELNFVLPVTAHENDSIRKGLQYGIGLSFL